MPRSRYCEKNERLDVVAGEAPAHLGQVVGAEGEELRRLGDLAGGQRRPRHLDHRADQRVHLDAGLLAPTSASTAQRLVRDDLQLLDRADQRHHDLRPRVAAGLRPLGRGLGDRPDLHARTGPG